MTDDGYDGTMDITDHFRAIQQDYTFMLQYLRPRSKLKNYVECQIQGHIFLALQTNDKS